MEAAQVLRSIVKPAGLPVPRISLPFSLERSSLRVLRLPASTRVQGQHSHFSRGQQEKAVGVQFTYTASDLVTLELVFGVDEADFLRQIDERNGWAQ